jgi:hypothetical protein
MIDIKELSEEITRAINLSLVNKVAEKPNIPLLNLEDVSIEVISKFLTSRHSSTWSIYSISSSDSLEAAAKWFKRELDLLYAFTYRPEEYRSLLE